MILSLSLFMFWILAQTIQTAFPSYKFTSITHFFNRCSDFHPVRDSASTYYHRMVASTTDYYLTLIFLFADPLGLSLTGFMPLFIIFELFFPWNHRDLTRQLRYRLSLPLYNSSSFFLQGNIKPLVHLLVGRGNSYLEALQ
ncbi:MAG: hypothetical protein FD167_5434 [bacterium]|nr:MAG: hypothetical protein FD167_5434 [bacterium]